MAAKKVVKNEEVAEKPTTELTKADAIWEKLKNIPIEIFALPGQTVGMHCKRVNVLPDQLFLISNGGAFLPALEDVMARYGSTFGVLSEHEKFEVDTDAKFVKVKIVSKY